MKEALAARKKQIQASLKDSKKELTEARKRLKDMEKKDNRLLAHKEIPIAQAEIARLKNEISFSEEQVKYLGATVHPVQFENGCVINLNLVKEYAKKLPKGTLVEFELVCDEGPVVLLSHKTGKFALKDLSKYYRGLKLPKGEDQCESLGIVAREAR